MNRLHSICCLLLVVFPLSIKTFAAQEYHKDIFLEFPSYYDEEAAGGVGPDGIGLDSQGHFCLMDTSTIWIYNDAGQVLRNFRLHDQYGKLISPYDFCFDGQGNVYGFYNDAGEAFIYKFDPQGLLQSKMSNDPQYSHDVFCGHYIAYIKGDHLMVYDDETKVIPIKYQAGQVAAIVRPQQLNDKFMIKPNKFVRVIFQTPKDVAVEIHKDNQPMKKLRFSDKIGLIVNPVYSYDLQYCYFYRSILGSYPGPNIREILKYDGDKLVFTTNPLALNTIPMAHGKKFVADAKGTIYYYAGDEKKIQILRWRLQ